MRPGAMPRSRRRPPHAQHMPSHIFTRVGYWKESIASNIEAARVAKEAEDFHDQLHAMDYLVYAYLQLGQDAKAKAVIDEMTTVTGFTETFLPGPYALAVSPARYAIERGDWKAAAELAGPSQPVGSCAGDHAFCARARRGPLGQSRGRQGRHRQARRAARQAARRQGRLLVRAGRYPAAGRDRLGALCRGQARRSAEGHERGRRCRGQDREASGDAGRAQAGARTLRRHAARARHAKEALAAFEATLKKEPNRLGAYAGAAKAAEKAGDKAKAQEYYEKIVAIAGDADKTPDRGCRRARIPDKKS